MYNTERYLSECLDSILAQSFEDYEIVIVNDGSTDGSLRICEDYLRRYPKKQITIVNQENSGLLMARRVGFANARGEYVWPIDSDDMIRDGALSLVDEAITRTNCDMVFFEYSLSREYTSKNNTCFPENCYFGPEDKTLLLKAYCEGFIYPLVSKVIRRDCLCLDKDYDSYGRLSNGEDELQVVDILNKIQSAVYIKEPLYHYRQNAESITGCYRKGVLLEHDKVMRVQVAEVGKWSEEYQDSSLEQVYKIAMLKNLYFNSRKCLNWRNHKQVLGELRSVEYYDYLFREVKSLRPDQRVFYSLLNHHNYTLAALSALLFRLISQSARRR